MFLQRKLVPRSPDNRRIDLNDKREQDRRGQPANLFQKIRDFFLKLADLIAHPAERPQDEHRDTSNERDRRNRRVRREGSRDGERRNRSRRA
jgi:hypothetical protein